MKQIIIILYFFVLSFSTVGQTITDRQIDFKNLFANKVTHEYGQISWLSCLNNGQEFPNDDTIELYRNLLSDNPSPMGKSQTRFHWCFNTTNRLKIEKFLVNTTDTSRSLGTYYVTKPSSTLSFKYKVKYNEKSKSYFLYLKNGRQRITYFIKDVHLDSYFLVDVVTLVRGTSNSK